MSKCIFDRDDADEAQVFDSRIPAVSNSIDGSQDRRGVPLVTLDSPMGNNGQDIYPDRLRELAKALLAIADEAERTKLGRHEQWKSGVVEFE
ncbi:hypothetical protein [Burkholderia mayonis]|uniref:hypothetical protein n=1 Tax=Burkholderia mayonis TaxID=1385591 RepID=UPI000A4B1597|nr:hypothetical protein [Burkholderia mayonis]